MNQNSNSSIIIPPLPFLPLPKIPVLTIGNFSTIENQKPKRNPPQQLKACNYTTIPFNKIKNSVF